MTTNPARPTPRTLALRGGAAITLSIAVNSLLVWAVTATGAVQPFRALAYPPVVLLTAVGAIGATIAYALITRWSRRPDRTFAIVASAVLIASFIPDITFIPTLPGATTAGVVVLMAMHATIAAICYAILTRPTQSDRP